MEQRIIFLDPNLKEAQSLNLFMDDALGSSEAWFLDDWLISPDVSSLLPWLQQPNHGCSVTGIQRYSISHEETFHKHSSEPLLFLVY